MCGIAETALIVGVLGTGISAYSSYQTGQSTSSAAKYNAEVADIQAHDKMQTGAEEAAAVRDRARRAAGTQAEGAAMSNVEISSGTPLALLTETAGLGELDAKRTMNNAKREAWGLSAQSELYSYQAKAAATAGALNAGGSLLTGAANTYYGAKQSGAFSNAKPSTTR